MGDGPARDPAGGVVEGCVAGKGTKSCTEMKALLPAVLTLLCLNNITSGLDSGDHSFGCTYRCYGWIAASDLPFDDGYV